MNTLFFYARKSTDVEDKQVMSIDAQLHELREFAAREQVNIVAELVEKQSAKTPGRPIFNDMLARIEAGEADGILAWHPAALPAIRLMAGRSFTSSTPGNSKCSNSRRSALNPTRRANSC